MSSRDRKMGMIVLTVITVINTFITVIGLSATSDVIEEQNAVIEMMAQEVLNENR